MAYLSRTQTAGDRRTWTQSGWYKLDGNDPGNAQSLISTNGTNTGTNFHYTIEKGGNTGGASDTISCHNYAGDVFTTTRVLRDYSSWYHIVLAMDTTQVSAADRIKLWVNNESVTITQAANYPIQDFEFGVNNSGTVLGIGTHPGSISGYQFTGLQANVELVDGLALTPAYFGSTDSNTGIWKPGGSSTISDYGTNGFKLKMDTTTPGADTSGKGNNYAVAAGTFTLTQGSPSNNWCTWNSLVPLTTNYVYSNGNNTVNQTSGAWVKTVSTIGVNSGKWYWEVSATNAQISAGKYTVIGVATTTSNTAPSGMPPNGIGMKNNGTVAISTSTVTTLSGFELGDIISCYLDMDNGALYYAKNGVMENSGVPTSGASKTGAFSLPNPTLPHFASLSPYGTNNKAEANFGEGFFGTTAAGTQADDNGQGLFAYDVPAGYYALNTKNLEAYG